MMITFLPKVLLVLFVASSFMAQAARGEPVALPGVASTNGISNLKRNGNCLALQVQGLSDSSKPISGYRFFRCTDEARCTFVPTPWWNVQALTPSIDGAFIATQGRDLLKIEDCGFRVTTVMHRAVCAPFNALFDTKSSTIVAGGTEEHGCATVIRRKDETTKELKFPSGVISLLGENNGWMLFFGGAVGKSAFLLRLDLGRSDSIADDIIDQLAEGGDSKRVIITEIVAHKDHFLLGTLNGLFRYQPLKQQVDRVQTPEDLAEVSAITVADDSMWVAGSVRRPPSVAGEPGNIAGTSIFELEERTKVIRRKCTLAHPGRISGFSVHGKFILVAFDEIGPRESGFERYRLTDVCNAVRTD